MTIKTSDTIFQIGRRLSDFLGEARQDEYKRALRWLSECTTVLDVACGTGTFLELRRGHSVGIDINPENVDYCLSRGIDAKVGNALDIPFPSHTFDGVHCSHLMQVFSPNDAAQLIRELGRVVKPGGVIVLVTLNWFPRFFRHPENVRAYPPDAIRRYFGKRLGVTSPMYPDMPPLFQEEIWLRRPALVELYSSTNYLVDGACMLLNRLQHDIFLRKYWRYDAYSIKLRCLKKE